MTLPECPRCDSATPLEKIRADDKGSILCYCVTCGKTALVKDGRVVYPPTSKTDLRGVVMTDP